MLEAVGVPPEQHGAALVALDKLDKIGRDGVAKELRSAAFRTAPTTLLEFFSTIAQAAATAGRDPAALQQRSPARV